jgi:hypothetical protein
MIGTPIGVILSLVGAVIDREKRFALISLGLAAGAVVLFFLVALC